MNAKTKPFFRNVIKDTLTKLHDVFLKGLIARWIIQYLSYNAGVAWSQHIGSRAANLFDSVAMAACFTIASLGVEPDWWSIVVVWIVAAALSVTAPVLSTGGVGLASVLTAVIGIHVARRGAERRRVAALAAVGEAASRPPTGS